MKLDKFYTNPKICDLLIQKLFEYFPNLKNRFFIEPSAGSGNFIKSLVKHGISRDKILGLDIDSNINSEIIKTDYLTEKIPFNLNNAIIGNPPFGKKSELAIDFLNKSLTESNFVAMILPKSFKRYFVQRKITESAKLILELELEENSFLVDDKEYNVNCVFQVWVLPSYKTYAENKRKMSKLPTKTNDFDTFLHNNTLKTLRYFNKEKYKWDFAIHRQGYYDYSTKITNTSNLYKNKQYVFIKLNNKKSKEIFDLIDFWKLSTLNTITPGFSLTDLVTEYNKQKVFNTLIEITLEKMRV